MKKLLNRLLTFFKPRKGLSANEMKNKFLEGIDKLSVEFRHEVKEDAINGAQREFIKERPTFRKREYKGKTWRGIPESHLHLLAQQEPTFMDRIIEVVLEKTPANTRKILVVCSKETLIKIIKELNNNTFPKDRPQLNLNECTFTNIIGVEFKFQTGKTDVIEVHQFVNGVYQLVDKIK